MGDSSPSTTYNPGPPLVTWHCSAIKEKGPGGDFSVYEQNDPDRAFKLLKNESPRVQNTLGDQRELGTSSLKCLKLLLDWFCSETDYQIRPDAAKGGVPPPWQHSPPPGPNPLKKDLSFDSSSGFCPIGQNPIPKIVVP